MLFYDKTKLKDYVTAIYPREHHDDWIRKIIKRRKQTMVCIMAGAAVLWCVCFFSTPKTPLQQGLVKREAEDYELEMEVSSAENKTTWKDIMTFEVGAKKLSAEEKKQLSAKVKAYLDKEIKGENSSLEQVEKDVHLVSNVPGCDVVLTCSFDENYLQEDGKIRWENIPEEGILTDVSFEASYLDWQEQFSYELFIMPPKDLVRKQKNAVKREIEQAIQERAEKEEIHLPSMVGGEKISYGGKEEKKDYSIVYVAVGMIFLIPLLWKEKEKKKLRERRGQMLCDHAGIVNKMMLLLGAGLTIRKAVERLVEEYEMDRKEGGEIHYAYEELCIMKQEMKDGKPEDMAMEAFGKRCRLLPYMRFASVISQNVRKGSEGILAVLEGDSIEALEQRKARALAQGEKAGTKLLFPMMIMLGLVMGIIMVPAFMTM